MSGIKICCVIGMLCLVPSMSWAQSLSIPVSQNSDDGTEVDRAYWNETGYASSINYLGRSETILLETGFRFHLPDLVQGEKIACARLKFSSCGGRISSAARFTLEGVLHASPTAFSFEERPSQKLPKTRCAVSWVIEEKWLEGSRREPLWYRSPNMAGILNEILSLPDWGTGPEGKTVLITLSDQSPVQEENFVTFNDFDRYVTGEKSPATLEICKTVYDCFRGKEMLGRVTDCSATVNLFPQIDMDLFIEYGTHPGEYGMSTLLYPNRPANQYVDIVMGGLIPNQRYYYRLNYRKSGSAAYLKGSERTFHTQRSKNTSFVFSMTADEHLQTMSQLPEDEEGKALYRQTLQNVEAGAPDFLISLGDFAHTEFLAGRNAANQMEAKDRYLHQREYIDVIAHSIPFYLAIGNHEGEQAWYGEPGNSNTLNYLSVRARKDLILNPQPGSFYSGNLEFMINVGFREDYFAWTWGSALFVVLDPYAYTKSKPYGEGGSENGWDWTLGKGQYDWLYNVLHNSTSRWKFVFLHHLIGTSVSPCYGRGGIEIAKYSVDHRPSFEWGGEDETGARVFKNRRPGWNHGPIHDILVETGVAAVFHGHDHFFAWQELDGIVYLECPQPGDTGYAYGYIGENLYKYGEFLPNSGHVEVSVNPDFLRLDYVRAYLPGDGVNGEIAFSRIID
ncbi:MAG: metallophosphoesterase [Planctomycetota bacterium]